MYSYRSCGCFLEKPRQKQVHHPIHLSCHLLTHSCRAPDWTPRSRRKASREPCPVLITKEHNIVFFRVLWHQAGLVLILTAVWRMYSQILGNRFVITYEARIGKPTRVLHLLMSPGGFTLSFMPGPLINFGSVGLSKYQIASSFQSHVYVY